MKKLLMLTVALTLFVFLLPILTLKDREVNLPPGHVWDPVSSFAPTPTPTPTNAVEAVAPINPNIKYLDDQDVTVRVDIDGKVYKIRMDVYLLGVLAAEMPPSFPLEALKAQVVAARTHTYNRMQEAERGNGVHADADVCSDPGHCKAYRNWDEVAAEWSDLGKNYVKKVEEAVESTSGEIMTYEGEPIVAVFHAASAEYTERAVDVWGSEVPYLQSVKSIKVGGISVTGTSMRFLYNLASANFSIRVSGDQIVFNTSGYGHGVGMSQYGAQALALDGKSYIDILRYYYTGVILDRIH